MASRCLAAARARLQSARRAFFQLGRTDSKTQRRKLRFESLERREVLTCIALTIDAPADVYEGIAFTVTGHISPAGTYTLEGDIYANGFYQEYPVATDENGNFTVSYLFGDDGPHPGNGTPSDVEDIDVTVWPVGEAENWATDDATVTVHNVNPTLDFQVSQSQGLFEVTGVVNEYSPAVPMMDYQLVRINWGDGSPETILYDVVPNVPIDAQYHTYPAVTATYTIAITSTDDDTGQGTQNLSAEVRVTNLTIHDGQNGPPALDEDNGGAVTVANLNDTDANGVDDYEDHEFYTGVGNGVQETRTGAEQHGRDEVDLMKLIVHKPVMYDGGAVTLTATPANRVIFWGDSKKTTIIDADYDPNATKLSATDWWAWG